MARGLGNLIWKGCMRSSINQSSNVWSALLVCRQSHSFRFALCGFCKALTMAVGLAGPPARRSCSKNVRERICYCVRRKEREKWLVERAPIGEKSEMFKS